MNYFDPIFANWILLLFNVLNAIHDGVRIKKNKPVYHALNLSIYVVIIAFMTWLFAPDVWYYFIPCAAFGRQAVFEPIMNAIRRKGIFYQSPSATAFFDKLEQRIFGSNGKLQLLIYAILWITLTVLQFV